MPLVTLVKTSIDDTVTARFFPAASQYERWVAIRDQLATWDVPVTVGQVTDAEQEYVELSFPTSENYHDMVKALKAAMHINDIVGNNEQARVYETYWKELPEDAPGAGEAVESDVFPQD